MKQYLFKALLVYFILMHPSISAAFTSETDESRPFQLYFDDETPLEVRDGRAEIDFLFQIPEKHYLYREILNVEFDSSKISFTIVKPGGVKKFDEFMGQEVEVYYNQTAVLAKIKFDDDYDFSQPLTGYIVHQGCSDRLCFRAITEKFTFKLIPPQASIKKPVDGGEQPLSVSKESDRGFASYLREGDFAKILGQGLWFALLITFLAGVLTSFTPCVLPIIPLTLAFIGVRTAPKVSTRVMHLAVFVSGVSLMYAVMGVASAAMGKTLGFLYQSPLFLLLLAGFFVMMSLWMFGLIQFNLPSRWQNAMARYQPSGYWRYLYSGITVGFLAAPCVGPILGPLLVYISGTQDLFLGFILMIAYALGMSVLFVFLGFASGSWIGSFGEKSLLVKRIFGTLLLLVSFYYFYLFAVPYLGRADSDAFFDRDLNHALTVAKQQKKGVMVDFYADWCLPCHEWDKTVWSNSEVQTRILEQFIPVKIDCTEETQECADAVERYNVIGWPTIVFVDGSGEETDAGLKRIVGQVLDASEFMTYIDPNSKQER